MSNGTYLTPSCQHCGRPIAGFPTYIGAYSYHPECTRGPGVEMAYQPMPFTQGAYAVPILTEGDVRRIVREELERQAQEASGVDAGAAGAQQTGAAK
jgi:hypothetical protein